MAHVPHVSQLSILRIVTQLGLLLTIIRQGMKMAFASLRATLLYGRACGRAFSKLDGEAPDDSMCLMLHTMTTLC